MYMYILRAYVYNKNREMLRLRFLQKPIALACVLIVGDTCEHKWHDPWVVCRL